MGSRGLMPHPGATEFYFEITYNLLYNKKLFVSEKGYFS